MKTKGWLISLTIALVGALIFIGVLNAQAVSGAAFTTYNAHVDGASKDVCKNSPINCNIYGAKQYVWLNGGPTANGIGPDGQYFFAVLVPGGQPNPNDGGPKNLSDDYDLHTNRIFTVTNGEVSAYTGTHWLDDGISGPKPNGKVPYIRLFPYADTTNPGGVYILAICSLQKGYPVDPRDCKYDAFKVRKMLTAGFMLSGIKFEDAYADGVKDPTAIDPGLSGWTITIKGTGFQGEPINVTVTTGDGGYWEWGKNYAYNKSMTLVPAQLQVCEVLQSGWTQSYPPAQCYDRTIDPAFMAYVGELDFGNWRPVEVKGCKVRDLDGVEGGATVPVEGWKITLTKEGVAVDTQPTGVDGCYKWTGLTPGFSYDLHEEVKAGWEMFGDKDVVFSKAKSGETFSHTFVNAALQGCTPGFWQGGNDFGTAGGQWLWNTVNDPQWPASGGVGFNPYIWETKFNDFFTLYAGLAGFDMMSLVGTGGGPDDFQKAARSLVAAYLNASWGMNYPYTAAQLEAKWAAAVSSGEFLTLHNELDAANNAYGRTDGGPHCPISASIKD